MIENVIKYIDSKNTWLKSQGYSVLQKVNEDLFWPMKRKGNEYEMIQAPDKLQEFSYWRVIAPVDVEPVQNDTSVKKLYKLSYPCKLIVCKKGIKSDDSQALNIMGQFIQLKKVDRAALEVYNLSIDFKNYNIIQESVVNEEFGDAFKVLDNYVFLSFNINIVITVDSECLETC